MGIIQHAQSKQISVILMWRKERFMKHDNLTIINMTCFKYIHTSSPTAPRPRCSWRETCAANSTSATWSPSTTNYDASSSTRATTRPSWSSARSRRSRLATPPPCRLCAWSSSSTWATTSSCTAAPPRFVGSAAWNKWWNLCQINGKAKCNLQYLSYFTSCNVLYILKDLKITWRWTNLLWPKWLF